MTVGQVLQTAITIVRAQAAAFVRIVLVVAVPLQVAAVGVALLVGGDDSGKVYRAGTVAVLVASLVAALIATVACFHLALQAQARQPATSTQGLAVSFTQLPSTLWIAVIAGLGVLGGSVLCLLPGIWLAVTWAFVFPVMLSEDAHGTTALRRSAGLVRDRWWATAGALLVAYVLPAVFVFVLQNVLLTVFGVDANHPNSATLVAVATATVVGQCVSFPFTSAFVAVLYLDLRDRPLTTKIARSPLAGMPPAPPSASSPPPPAASFPPPAASPPFGPPSPTLPDQPVAGETPVQGGFLPPVAPPRED